MFNWFKNIGLGTVTLCSLAGVQFGYALLWAMT